jgi:hypothetical protein
VEEAQRYYQGELQQLFGDFRDVKGSCQTSQLKAGLLLMYAMPRRRCSFGLRNGTHSDRYFNMFGQDTLIIDQDSSLPMRLASGNFDVVRSGGYPAVGHVDATEFKYQMDPYLPSLSSTF